MAEFIHNKFHNFPKKMAKRGFYALWVKPKTRVFVYIGAEGAFTKISRPVNQKWISQSGTRGTLWVVRESNT